jgi:hypothetical protein
MTSLQAVINGVDLSAVLNRVDVWRDSGGVGRWAIEIDDSDNVSASILNGAVLTFLGVNGESLIKGYVDTVTPVDEDTAAVCYKTAKIEGRSYGRDLVNLTLNKVKYTGKIDDDFAQAIIDANSELTYVSPSVGPEVEIEFKRTYLQTAFAQACQEKNYDFDVTDNKELTVWSLTSPPNSGVLLQSLPNDSTNNILHIKPHAKTSVDVKNNIVVVGGDIRDHYTELNAADFTPALYCTVTDDKSFYVAGGASVRATLTGAAGQTFALFYLTFPRYNHPYLEYDELEEEECCLWTNISKSGSHAIHVYAMDDEGNEIYFPKTVNGGSDVWTKVQFQMGTCVKIVSDGNIDHWSYKTGSTFTWRIMRLGLRYAIDGIDDSGIHFWLDGLNLGGLEAFAVAQDTPSQTRYGKRDSIVNRTDITSQKQLESIAQAELLNRRDEIEKLTLICKFTPSLKYGNLVSVLVPDSGVGSVPDVGSPVTVQYKILSVHHYASPSENLCRNHDAVTEVELIRYYIEAPSADPVRYQLQSTSQAAINTRVLQRVDVLEKSLSGSGSVVGNGSGGGGYIGGEVSWGDITGKPAVYPSAWSEISDIPSTFPPSSHNHDAPISEWLYYTKYPSHIIFNRAVTFAATV